MAGIVLQVTCAQKLQVISSFELSEELNEISGLITFEEPREYYAINDGGNPNYIFQIDSVGTVLRRIFVKGAVNRDWEEIFTDQNGFVYISDTGDNKKIRSEYFLFKIAIEDLRNLDTVVPQIIRIRFVKLDSKKALQIPVSVNVEAVCCLKDKVYFFTKEKARHLWARTSLYIGNCTDSIQDVMFQQTIQYSSKLYAEDLITGACSDPNSGNIYWTSASRWFCIEKAEFNKMIKLDYPTLSQKESISFLSPGKFVITHEKNKPLNQNAAVLYISIQ